MAQYYCFLSPYNENVRAVKPMSALLSCGLVGRDFKLLSNSRSLGLVWTLCYEGEFLLIYRAYYTLQSIRDML